MPILSILLAGALLCAVFGYLSSFRQLPVYAYLSSPAAPTQTPPLRTESMIDINSATFEELLTLPGIGETTARAILDLRMELGAFRIKEDLLLVKGIGEKKFSDISKLIYIR